jgi:hypothetical protein
LFDVVLLELDPESSIIRTKEATKAAVVAFGFLLAMLPSLLNNPAGPGPDLLILC